MVFQEYHFSFKESRLLVLYAQLPVNSGKNSLHLPHCEHTAEEAVTGIVAPVLVAQHGHAVVNAHWQRGVGLLEDTRQLDYIRPAAEVRSLGKVAVGEHMA